MGFFDTLSLVALGLFLAGLVALFALIYLSVSSRRGEISHLGIQTLYCVFIIGMSLGAILSLVLFFTHHWFMPDS